MLCSAGKGSIDAEHMADAGDVTKGSNPGAFRSEVVSFDYRRAPISCCLAAAVNEVVEEGSRGEFGFLVRCDEVCIFNRHWPGVSTVYTEARLACIVSCIIL